MRNITSLTDIRKLCNLHSGPTRCWNTKPGLTKPRKGVGCMAENENTPPAGEDKADSDLRIER
jgi:hypothetical protein